MHRNILKTNDVRTGLKKPEQDEKKKRAATAQLADTPDAPAPSHRQTDAATPSGGTDALGESSHLETAKSQAPATAASDAVACAQDERDIAKAARER